MKQIIPALLLAFTGCHSKDCMPTVTVKQVLACDSELCSVMIDNNTVQKVPNPTASGAVYSVCALNPVIRTVAAPSPTASP